MGKRGPKPRDEVERFKSYVPVSGADECWHWTGPHFSATNYGTFNRVDATGKWHATTAHRFAYELWVGPIADGLHVDHVCHNRDRSCAGGKTCPHRRCVNPRHLEPVTNRENGRRGRVAEVNSDRLRARTHCIRGHELPPPLDRGEHRHCQVCARLRQAGYRAKQPKAPPRTTCRNGHPLEMSYVSSSGETRCRGCQRERAARYKARLRS